MRRLTKLAIASFICLRISVVAVQADANLPPSADVIKVVLKDVAELPNELAPLSFSRSIPRQLRASLVSVKNCPNDFSWLAEDVSAAVPRRMRSAVVQANEDVHRRAVDADVAVALNLDQAVENPQCSKTSVDSAGNLTWNYVCVYPPGYSAADTIAVVRLYFPELLHPSLAVYVVKRHGTEWRILARKVVTLA